MMRKMIGAALGAAVLLAASPSAHAGTSPKWGDTVERKQQIEHDRIQRKQVKQRGSRPIYEPIFHPLYQGYNSPVQRVKRAFN